MPNLRDYLFYEEPGITLYCGDCREILFLIRELGGGVCPDAENAMNAEAILSSVSMEKNGVLSARHIEGTLVTDGQKEFIRNSQFALVTDPPYGPPPLSPLFFRTWRYLFRTLAIFGYPEDLVSLCISTSLLPTEWIAWCPTNKVTRSSGLMREMECIGIFGPLIGLPESMSKRAGIYRSTASITATRGLNSTLRKLGDVWHDPSPGMAFNSHLREHPNEKPESVMRKLVILCSDVSDIIVDPFCGSGTTLVAAKNLHRRAIGIEIEPKYCEIAVKRLRQEVLPL